jgi:ribonuclease HII
MGGVAGVDDAGRGCVIGPLVVAGVLIDENKIIELCSMGVRDSKKLSSKKRETLVPKIEELATKCSYFELSPLAIDRVVERNRRLRKLNYLEAMAMARVIRDLRPQRVYVDPSDVIPERYAEQIIRVLPFRVGMVCEHHADEKYVVVSAASILAKVRRDRIVSELRIKHGDFGSGYPNDVKTITFLEAWFREREMCPKFVRSSWSTVKRIRSRFG